MNTIRQFNYIIINKIIKLIILQHKITQNCISCVFINIQNISKIMLFT